MMNPLNLTDSHAHLTSSLCANKAEEMLQHAFLAGVKTIINICTDKEALELGLKLAKEHLNVYNVGATHPEEVEMATEESFAYFTQKAHSGALVAIGETGLDYHHQSSRPLQHEFLRRYLQLAQNCNLPLVFHCREAFDDLFRITDEMNYPFRAVLHCFTGTAEQAEQVLARGWYLSFSGIVTYKKNDALRAIAKEVPIERVLVETDTPFLAPQTKRGKPNEPLYMIETAQLIANLRGMPLIEFAEATTENAQRLFDLKH